MKKNDKLWFVWALIGGTNLLYFLGLGYHQRELINPKFSIWFPPALHAWYKHAIYGRIYVWYFGKYIGLTYLSFTSASKDSS